MTASRTITDPPQPPPGDQGDDEPASRQPVGQFRVALEPASGAQPTGELERQLRKRLRVIILIVLAFYAAQVVRFALALLGWLSVEAGDWPAFGCYGLILTTAAVLAAILWSRRPLSLRGLRAIELATFLPLVAFGAWLMQGELRSGWVRHYAAAGDVGVALVARAHGLNWFALIVIYGAFIPNTWRRCAGVAALMALTPVAAAALVGLPDDLLRTRLLPGYLADLAVWLATAVAVAVYGSHRIEVLRRQALQARRLGQYQLLRRLGAGGMGEVYLAEHVLLRRPCALKVIRPGRAGDPQQLLRFEREVRTTATLTHPNTVQVFDYGHAEDGTFYYVMEYLPGLTLEQLVRRHGRLPPARAVHFLRQVCGALHEAHSVGLIHRDVKPGNVMICERGGLHDVAKLLDFGLVLPQAAGRDGERLTQEGIIAGTPAYMSPEQAAGRDDLDARSDVYSVGCLAYCLLTGRPPFAGRAAVGMVAAHLYEAPAPLRDERPDVPEGLQVVVLRCLAKDPAERFASARDLAGALAACDAGQWTEGDAAAWWRANGV